MKIQNICLAIGLASFGVIPQIFSAQADNSDTFSSHSSSSFPILVALRYGEPRSPAEAIGILAQFESIADSAYRSAMRAWENRQYNQAFNLFHQAADNYWLCSNVKFITGENRTRVLQKYSKATSMRDKAHQLR